MRGMMKNLIDRCEYREGDEGGGRGMRGMGCCVGG